MPAKPTARAQNPPSAPKLRNSSTVWSHAIELLVCGRTQALIPRTSQAERAVHVDDNWDLAAQAGLPLAR